MRDAIVAQAYLLAAKRLFGDPNHADWIYERIRRPRSMWVAVANLFYYLLRQPRICDVTTLQLEPVFACNLRCKYCPGHDAPGRVRPRLMSWEIFRRIVDRLPPSVEAVQFALLGEPLLHPDLGEMIKHVHRRGRRAIVYTNGTLLRGDRLEMLVRSRVDVVNISSEVDAETSRDIRGVDLDTLRRNVRAFAERKAPDTEIKLSVVVHEGNVDRVPRLYDSWRGLIEHFKVYPAFYLDAPHPPPVCMELWRGNLNIWTNGNVSPCCFDPDGELVIGNVLTEDLAYMIRGPRMTKLLQNVLEKRPPGRCLRCRRFEGYQKGFHVTWT